jgi:hypothetical protein
VNVRRIWSIAKCLGWDNIPPRIKYLLKKKSGYLAAQTAPAKFSKHQFAKSDRSPHASASENWHSKRDSFFPIANSNTLRSLIPESVWHEHVTQVCEQALAGDYPFFSRWTGDLSWPPNFNRDPINDVQWSVADHWSKSQPSKLPKNDIKLVWEASRLSLAYTLSRQYIYTQEERWAESFWQMVDAWIEQNPVNQSVAWECSQEVAFRLMAILWGVFSTLDSPAATEQRLAAVRLLVWQFGKRIALTPEYAISQENNHALSEAAGLWTIGLVFPEFAESKRWQATGKSILQKETKRQIYDDGSYVQNSFSYHRVMLDDLMWAIQIGRINNQPLAETVVQRLSLATKWLGKFIIAENGRVPNYGANDGANVLPLSCSDYLDYRPTLLAAETIAGLPISRFEDSSISEKALWLTGTTPKSDPVAFDYQNWNTEIGGYHALTTDDSQLLVRCVNHKDRPGQSDMLHVDYWFRGVNVFRDSGSFRYNHENAELKKYFGSVAAHNTVQVGELGQMTKGPSFLWLDWPKTEFSKSTDGQRTTFDCIGKFTSGGQTYQHSRSIQQTGDVFQVVDSVNCRGPFKIYWHLDPGTNWQPAGQGRWLGVVDGQEILIAVTGADNIQLDSAPESLYYGEKTDHPVLIILSDAAEQSAQSLPAVESLPICTTFGPKMAVETIISG